MFIIRFATTRVLRMWCLTIYIRQGQEIVLGD